MSKIHGYFKRKCAKWGIIDFLNECGIEPFDSMIDEYIKSLEAIVNSGQGEDQKQAKRLLEKYRKASKSFYRKCRKKNSGVTRTSLDPRPDYQSARKWKIERNSTSASDEPSVYFHNSTFTGNLVRTGSIGGNLNLSNKVPKRKIDNEKNDDIKEERASKRNRPQSPENEITLPLKNQDRKYKNDEANLKNIKFVQQCIPTEIKEDRSETDSESDIESDNDDDSESDIESNNGDDPDYIYSSESSSCNSSGNVGTVIDDSETKVDLSEFEREYSKMNKSDKWTLSTGKVV
ncbi:hypothetical protein F8M41_022011 [Gigaspora margarita]|uniref:Uncharacterized protein n=1 Tax=Gigaspora margarita TaxID=4874 RepID=A0A8H4AFS2_GIGMA|nr:hypothetical protein F8M41_022011 [Gigaspora margarita]